MLKCFHHSSLTAWTWKMGPIGCPKTSVTNYQSMCVSSKKSKCVTNTHYFLKTCNTAFVLVNLPYDSRYSVPTWGCAQWPATCKSSTLREMSSRYVFRANMIGMHLAVAAVHAGTICASSPGTVGSWLLLSCTLVYYWHMYCLPFLKKRNLPTSCGMKACRHTTQHAQPSTGQC